MGLAKISMDDVWEALQTCARNEVERDKRERRTDSGD